MQTEGKKKLDCVSRQSDLSLRCVHVSFCRFTLSLAHAIREASSETNKEIFEDNLGISFIISP